MLRIFFSSHGERAFSALSGDMQKRVAEELTRLTQDPFWYRRVKKLRGNKSRYRFRVERWRVLFTLRGGDIEIADIFMKKGRNDYRRRS